MKHLLRKSLWWIKKVLILKWNKMKTPLVEEHDLEFYLQMNIKALKSKQKAQFQNKIFTS